ncbi:MAG: glucokinase [Proteobacteria bacterium]|nr:glucokinase [Pseudomonadota bacterium]
MTAKPRAGAPVRLLGDIGGTNARFALQTPGAPPKASKEIKTADFADLTSAAKAYLAATSPARPPRVAAFAVACPVTGDEIRLTNSPWSFSATEVQSRLGLDSLHVINDFEAIAWSVPRLGAGDVRKIGGGRAQRRAPIAVIGPGTGLGVSALVPSAKGWRALATEGGHVTLAPANAREGQVLDILRRKFSHVSAERALSGQGLVELYEAISLLDGTGNATAAGKSMTPTPMTPAAMTPAPMTPAKVTRRALGRRDPAAVRALRMFSEMLGTVAGNLALTLGARGGVYLAGGVVPRLGRGFAAAAFRRRFEDKGRFSAYLGAIPTYLITHKTPAFAGLASFLDAEGL